MILKVTIGIGLLIALFLIYVAFQPGDFRVERSILIKSKAERIFPLLNNLRKAEAWNPFYKLDPEVQVSYTGPEQGVGAKMTWKGNAQAGEGSMEIIESVANQVVRTRLDFIKPFAGTNFGEYSVNGNDLETTVIWVTTGQTAFIPRVICMFVSMDRLIGSQLESGLAQLKKVSESGSEP